MMAEPHSPVAEQWNIRYSESDYFYGTAPNDFLRNNFGSIQKGKVLCLADGEGRNSVFLAEQGYNVTSVDISSVGVEKTRRLASERGVTVNAIVGDLTDFDLGNHQWNGVVSIFCHLSSELRRRVHQRVVKSLVSGGVVLLEAYTINQIGRGTGGPQVADFLMSELSLRSEFSQLTPVHLAEIERTVSEGAGHTGMAAVVQMIARK